MSIPYTPPKALAKAFNCPNCGAFSHQSWAMADLDLERVYSANSGPIRTAKCAHCNGYSVWRVDTLLVPPHGSAPLPNADLPASVAELYLEAADLAGRSSRASAALLRLAIHVLCKELGEEGENLNAAIGSLVKKGLSPMVQQALDTVRVIGNNAVHPGQISIDDPDVVGTLFKLVNLIAEQMITHPKAVQVVYNSLPAGALNQIKKRDCPEGGS